MDKDIIISRQNAYIAFLKHEIAELNIEIGKLKSEVDYLNSLPLSSKIDVLLREIETRDSKNKGLSKAISTVKANNKILRHNNAIYKHKLKQSFKILYPNNWIEEMDSVRKLEKPMRS